MKGESICGLQSFRYSFFLVLLRLPIPFVDCLFSSPPIYSWVWSSVWTLCFLFVVESKPLSCGDTGVKRWTSVGDERLICFEPFWFCCSKRLLYVHCVELFAFHCRIVWTSIKLWFLKVNPTSCKFCLCVSICSSWHLDCFVCLRTEKRCVRLAVFIQRRRSAAEIFAFATRVIVLCSPKNEKSLAYSSTVEVRSNIWKTTPLLPAPMAISYLYVNVAQHLPNLSSILVLF